MVLKNSIFGVFLSRKYTLVKSKSRKYTFFGKKKKESRGNIISDKKEDILPIMPIRAPHGNFVPWIWAPALMPDF